MSADNWAECPQCADQAAQHKGLRRALADHYRCMSDNTLREEVTEYRTIPICDLLDFVIRVARGQVRHVVPEARRILGIPVVTTTGEENARRAVDRIFQEYGPELEAMGRAHLDAGTQAITQPQVNA